MDLSELAELRYETGYVFENGTVFYERLGEERALGILSARDARGYRIVRERDVSIAPRERVVI
jgi:hypothetical protein